MNPSTGEKQNESKEENLQLQTFVDTNPSLRIRSMIPLFSNTHRNILNSFYLMIFHWISKQT